MQVDPGGWIPKWLVNILSVRLVLVIDDLYKIAQSLRWCHQDVTSFQSSLYMYSQHTYLPELYSPIDRLHNRQDHVLWHQRRVWEAESAACRVLVGWAMGKQHANVSRTREFSVSLLVIIGWDCPSVYIKSKTCTTIRSPLLRLQQTYLASLWLVSNRYMHAWLLLILRRIILVCKHSMFDLIYKAGSCKSNFLPLHL